MPFLFLSLILFFTTSCFVESESDSRFHGDRTKLTSSVERQRPGGKTETSGEDSEETDKDSVQGENLVFPFVFNSNHVKIHLQPQEEQKKMLISVEPEGTPVPLIAGFSGAVSIKENTNSYIASISPKNSRQVLFFELNKEHTKLFVADGASVTQKTSIAESSRPVLFYVKKDDQLTRLCFSVEQLSGNVAVTQDYEDHPDCEK